MLLRNEVRPAWCSDPFLLYTHVCIGYFAFLFFVSICIRNSAILPLLSVFSQHRPSVQWGKTKIEGKNVKEKEN